MFELVWCLSPDRLARAYAYQVLVLDELARFGVSVRFTDAPDLADGDPQAVLLTQVQGVIAEYEKAKIAERYRRGKLFRARAGEIITWKTSYGYRRVARAGAVAAHLEIYEPEAAVVRRIFADRAAGISVREICRRLNADRVASPTGKATWGTSTLCRLLGNEAYIGRVYFNRTETITDPRPARRTRQVQRPREDWIPIGCPSIITDDQFETASRVAYDNAKWSPRRAEPGEWLLKGLVKCGVCDVGTNCHKMRGRNGTWHRYYYCRNHDPLRRRRPGTPVPRTQHPRRRARRVRLRPDPGRAHPAQHAAGRRASDRGHHPDPRRRAARRRTRPPRPQDRRHHSRTTPAGRPLPGRAHRPARTATPLQRSRRTAARPAGQT